jgi:dihydroorotase
VRRKPVSSHSLHPACHDKPTRAFADAESAGQGIEDARTALRASDGEVTDTEVDVFDREAVFIDRLMQPLRRDFPSLKVVFEHITTKDAAQYVAAGDAHAAATITAHHLLYNRNAIFMGGLRPHHYCSPVLKREVHRQALVQAATSGSAKFFLGTDSAPHAAALKEASVCGAGCYTAPAALELYAGGVRRGRCARPGSRRLPATTARLLRPARNQARVTLRREP